MQKLRVEYWQKIIGVQEEDLVFIDEAGVNLALVRLDARAVKGKRARGVRPQKRGKNVSMIGAVALKGIVASVNIYGSSDGVTFEAFVLNKLVPQLWSGACVVLDNSTIHKGEEIQAAIEAVGAKLIFLSPTCGLALCSPEFNPIENLWSKLKSTLRSIGARTYQALDEAIGSAGARRGASPLGRSAIAEAYAQISLDNIRNWFVTRS